MRFPKFSNLFALLAMLLVGLAVLAQPTPARAGFEGITQTVDMASGTSVTAVTIPLVGTAIKDVVAWVPTLDSGDTSTVTLRVNAFDSTYTPNGWTDKGVGATEDNALVKCNATQLNVIVDGSVTITVQTSTNQAAARRFKLLILREY